LTFGGLHGIVSQKIELFIIYILLKLRFSQVECEEYYLLRCNAVYYCISSPEGLCRKVSKQTEEDLLVSFFLPTFVAYFSTMKMEEEYSSETTANFFPTTWSYILEDSTLHEIYS
jgi:hypothetical protein